MDAADQLSDGLDFGSQDCIPLKNQYYFGVMFYRGQGFRRTMRRRPNGSAE